MKVGTGGAIIMKFVLARREFVYIVLSLLIANPGPGGIFRNQKLD